MNRFTTANLQNGILRYKHLTVGDVRPDATTKLYKRMFKASSRKYIPVKDVTNDTMGRELNAYLINPEYIDKSVVDPDLVAQQLEPHPVIKAIQYSKLSYAKPMKTHSKSAVSRMGAVFGAALHIGKRVLQSTRQVFTTALHSPFGKTYSLREGTGIHRRRRLVAKAGGLVAVASFGILALNSLNTTDTTVSPKPPTTQVSNSAEGPLTASGITSSQPIPIFGNPTVINTPGAAPTQRMISPVQSVTTTTGSYTNVVASPTNSSPAPVAAVGGMGGGETVTVEPVPTTPDPVTVDPVPTPSVPDANTNILTPVVDGVVDTTTQTLEAVDGLVDGLLGQ